MLGIDGQLREPGAVEALMRYGFERLRTGITRDAPPPRWSGRRGSRRGQGKAAAADTATGFSAKVAVDCRIAISSAVMSAEMSANSGVVR